ncbi:hypothetical protein AVEN_123721-1 [Araneus ventricosus]|uniref:Uncharacterized protein n=1 Tax=Araneus ventricosus TaxID=182803 RepID=A0A4Y2K6S8_ARAVE|nr:hypothetical protein AVEN_123721-1 [Araneus ventricosus]
MFERREENMWWKKMIGKFEDNGSCASARKKTETTFKGKCESIRSCSDRKSVQSQYSSTSAREVSRGMSLPLSIVRKVLRSTIK